LLTEAQIKRLHEVIDQWRAQQPEVRAVAYIHFLDFARAVGAPSAGEERRPGNLFAVVGLDPLSELDSAVQQIAQTRELAERAIYYMQRMPSLLEMRIENHLFLLLVLLVFAAAGAALLAALAYRRSVVRWSRRDTALPGAA